MSILKKINLSGIKPSTDVVQGLSAKLFLKHFPLIVLFAFLSMAYISVRYDCITAMETVAHLKTRLAVTRTEAQRERSEYMSSTCESAMQQRVDTMHLGLRIQERPPYRISLAESSSR